MSNILTSKKYLTGSTLKIIAITSMIIDHTAASIFPAISNFSTINIWPLYDVMRSIGRIAFPIFCFLLVEGFIHTKSLKKYIFTLGLFALISELPFDLAFSERLSFDYQNVFFTLFISVLVLTSLKTIDHKYREQRFLKTMLFFFAVFFGCLMATILKTDYSSMGVLTVVAFYLAKIYSLPSVVGLVGLMTSFIILQGPNSTLFEAPALLSLIPIHLYNNKRGLSLKYFFYIFYPLHLTVLYLIAHYISN